MINLLSRGQTVWHLLYEHYLFSFPEGCVLLVYYFAVPQWHKVAVPNQGYGSPTRGHRMINKKGERRKIYLCCKNSCFFSALPLIFALFL